MDREERAHSSPIVLTCPQNYQILKDVSSCAEYIRHLLVKKQHLFPDKVYTNITDILELLRVWHDQKPELDRIHGDLFEAVKDLCVILDEYSLLTRYEMSSTDKVSSVNDALNCIKEQIDKLRSVSRIQDVTINLEDLSIEPEDLPKIKIIEDGFCSMKSQIDGNEELKSEESDTFFRTALSILETISYKSLRMLSRTLKTIIQDSSPLLEAFIRYYLNQGVNSLFAVQLLKLILCSSKVHVSMRKKQKDHFTTLFVIFYTSQSQLLHADASEAIAIFIRETYDDNQLIDLFEKIDFARTNMTAYMKPLFEAFFSKYVTDDVSLRFIRTLVEAKKLQHFDNEIVARDTPVERFLKIINQYCLMRPKSTLLGRIMYHSAFHTSNLCLKLGQRKWKASRQDRFSRAFNLTFVRSVKAHFHSVPENYQPMFVRIMYFAAQGTPNSIQISEGDINLDQEAVAKLVNLLNKLSRYVILDIHTFIWKKFLSGAGNLRDHSFRDCIDYLSTIVEHVTSVPQTRLGELETLTLKKGAQKSGKVAIQELIKHLFKGDDPFKWDATSINDRVLYLYCFFRYPFEAFVNWTQQLNTSTEFFGRDELNLLFSLFNEKKKRVIGLDSISKYGYKYIQNNQLTTILAALDATSGGKHFFAKQGTGQGKSLTLALLALNYAKQGKRVMIFSCYDHLAKRDHASFQQMYTDHRITSAYVESANSESLDAQVMYANLETFIRLYYENTAKLVQGDEEALKNFSIFGIDVILLDEFDALILDSRKIGNRVYEMSSFYSLGTFASAEIARNTFKTRLGNVDGMRQFVHTDWTSQLVDLWTTSFSVDEGRQTTDYLGNQVSYVGGEWYELSRGKFYLYSSKIDVLSYLLSASIVVGVSGSINEDSMRTIREALTSIDRSKEVQYLNIPNFYGIEATRNVLKVRRENLSRTAWTTEILNDLNANGVDRPVLVFGNINEPDQWNKLRSLLESYAQDNGRHFQVIDKEQQTEGLAMIHACDPKYITLASHIVGRGADFKVHPDIDLRGGLHVLIAGIPNNDYRLYAQMIGRTARMTNQGSHSVILMATVPGENVEPINISTFQKEMNEVIAQVQGFLTSIPYSNQNWRRWLIILNSVLHTRSWPVQGNTDTIALELAKKVVDRNIRPKEMEKFRIKRNTLNTRESRRQPQQSQCVIA